MNFNKEDLILGIDIGYSACKCILLHKDGTTIKKFKFPSYIGVTKSNIDGVMNDKIYHYGGKNEDEGAHYFVGEDARHLPSANLVEINDYKNIEYYAPLFIYHAMKLAGILNIGVSKVVTGLSIAQIQNSGYFQEAISHYVVDGVEFKNDVLLLPQGAGIKLAYDKFGARYPEVQKEFLGEANYVIADIGFNTVDMLLIADGKTDPNLFEGIEKSGVMRIAAQMAKIINEKHQRQITLQEAREILDSGVYKLRGTKHNYSAEVQGLKDDFLKEILKLINERYGHIIDKVDFLVIAGGGSYLFSNSSDGFIRVIERDSEYYNAIGEALYGLQNS